MNIYTHWHSAKNEVRKEWILRNRTCKPRPYACVNDVHSVRTRERTTCPPCIILKCGEMKLALRQMKLRVRVDKDKAYE